ncbi:ATP-binding protein [Microbacterium sp. cx-59]|uniref:ATP-binding protein n=1 Tax=Microbacterium sp. cx-59 TaxID=2891207 RepID=UPI001E4C73F4|nr:ATP-binding protein [Microbacterium sp. cx-59]MCC4909170.1 MASE1 domain-containing protein [Microbacterium sp. cx-59]
MEPATSLTSLGGGEYRSWVPSWWVWLLAAVTIGALGVWGVTSSGEGSIVAAWWPAAGVSVAFVLANPPRRRLGAIALVLVVTAAANLIGGREPGVAVGFAIANAAEAAVVVAILAGRRRRFALSTVIDGLRFVLAVAAGALVIGALAGAVVAVRASGDFGSTFATAASSHAAAVLLIAPFAVLPEQILERFSWVEVALQTVLVGATVYLVFRTGAQLPLAFIPLTFVAWAAFRFPMVMALAQSLLIGVAVLLLSLAGGGPFGILPTVGIPSAALIDVFLVALAVMTVLLVTARNQLRVATRAAAQTMQLVTGGFVGSEVGLLIAGGIRGASRVVWANGAGQNAVAAEVDDDGRWSGPLEAGARTALDTGAESVYERDGYTVRIVANPLPELSTRFAVQIIDVSSTVRMTQVRVEAELERDAARTARMDLERQREDFVATTSHELRTPITSILGYSEFLAESDDLTATEREWVGVIMRNGARLSALVEDLLTLGRASAAPVNPAAVRTLDSHDLIHDVVMTQQPIADAKSLTIRVQTQDDDTVRVYPPDAVQSLGNLVSNALKFTPNGGSIRIRTTQDGDDTVISVADSGPGMPADARAHAFDRFYRAPAAERENTPGAGLGLSIARELAERNGGTIELSAGENSGLVASLRLPRG